MTIVRWPAEEPGTEVWWSSTTGRFALLHESTVARLTEEAPGPRLKPLLERLKRLGLREGGLPLAERVVVASKAILLLPERPALWLPVPTEHGAGGLAYRALLLTPDGLRVWREVNDRRTPADIAAALGWSTDRVLGVLQGWTDPEVQAVQLRAQAPRILDPTLLGPRSTPRAANIRTADQHGTAGETTLTEYHLHHITDGDTHFDDRETTVAHALALPHDTLGGRRFGEALRAGLAGYTDHAPGVTVEIGCGTGELAAAFAAGHPGLYLRVDLSPELLRTQAKNAVATQGVLADGTRLPLRDQSADWVVSNEVIADLSAVPFDFHNAPTTLAEQQVHDLVTEHRLTTFRGRKPYNLGAWQMLLEVARVLKPGGLGYLSEFGTLDQPPEEAQQLDHPEVSIHFGQLAALAASLGLDAKVLPMAEVVDADLTARHIARPCWMAARALARSAGVHLPARSHTPESLQALLPEPVEGLWTCPVTSPGPGPLITRFYAVIVRKPPQ